MTIRKSKALLVFDLTAPIHFFFFTFPSEKIFKALRRKWAPRDFLTKHSTIITWFPSNNEQKLETDVKKLILFA